MKREDFILPIHAEERKRTKKNTESTFSNFQISDDIVNLGYGKKYFIHTYGCQANVRDGEALAGMVPMFQMMRMYYSLILVLSVKQQKTVYYPM